MAEGKPDRNESGVRKIDRALPSDSRQILVGIEYLTAVPAAIFVLVIIASPFLFAGFVHAWSRPSHEE